MINAYLGQPRRRQPVDSGSDARATTARATASRLNRLVARRAGAQVAAVESVEPTPEPTLINKWAPSPAVAEKRRRYRDAQQLESDISAGAFPEAASAVDRLSARREVQ